MDSKIKNVIIFKNDAVGDLTQSLHAIDNIITKHKKQKIIIYLSERSKKFNFLINGNNLEFRQISYDLTLIEKLRLFITISFSSISDIYILTPKNFYYFLSPIFKQIRFNAICINGRNNYKRPSQYLRKFLHTYVINDRSVEYKREHTSKLQSKLIDKNNLVNNIHNYKISVDINNFLKKRLPKNYIYFHIKKDITDQLQWDFNNINLLFNELLKFSDNIVFTKDIEKNYKNHVFRNKFNVIDFQSKQISETSIKSNIYLFDNIEGEDLYNTIKYASKIIAFHGMMTNLASLEKKKVIDMWFLNIKNLDDYKNYRNAFYEFKPSYKGYNFMIPKKNIFKTIKKIKSLMKND
jgi:hypothetical protein